MTNADLFARTAARHIRWDQTARCNESIRRRIRAGEPVQSVAGDFGVPAHKVQRIAGLFGG